MKTYSLQEILPTHGDYLITGMQDDAVEIEPGGDLYTLAEGGDQRDNTRVRTNIRSAKVTFRLKQGSPANDYFSSLVIQDRLGGGVRVLQIRDLNGTSLFVAPRCWIMAQPTQSFGSDVGDRVWVLQTDFAESYVGGLNP